MKNFFREFKRRQIYRVAVTYVIASWVILQIISVIIPLIEAPSWIGKTVLILLLVGFPVALILTWGYTITPQDINKKPSETESLKVVKDGLDLAILSLASF